MSTRDDVYAAIRNADKAGDSEAVRKLGAYLETLPKDDAPSTPARATDVPNAVGTGFNKGVLRTIGLPVDTLLNVVDLAKAPFGAAYIAATGRDAPNFLQPFDREKYVGSSENLIAAAKKYAPSTVVAQNPDYEGGYLQAAGGGLSGVINPRSRLEAANQAGLGITSALAGKFVYDKTGDPALAAAAGLAPHATQQTLTSATKYAVRGGEAGRKAMEQRIEDLRRAGITEPTLGLASGNETIGGAENIIGQTPGGVGIIRRARDKAVAGLEAKVAEAAANASTNRGTTEAGAAVQAGARTFRDDVKARQEGLYSNLATKVDPASAVDVSNTEGALNRLTTLIPGANATSRAFVNGRISDIKAGFDKDTGTIPTSPSRAVNIPARVAYTSGNPFSGVGVPDVPFDARTLPGTSFTVPGRLIESSSPFSGVGGPPRAPAQAIPAATITVPARSAGSTSAFSGIGVPAQEPQAVSIPGQTAMVGPKARRTSPLAGAGGNFPLAAPELPYDAVRKLRTNVGDQLTDSSLVTGAPTAQWRQLYGSLSEDMRGAATNAGPDAIAAWNRANDYTRSSIGRLERIAPTVDKPSPEGTYHALERSLKENTSTFQAVKKSLPEGARGDFAGTVIERLGTARPGQQNAAGDVWSPETFLTNWNGMAPKARAELLSGFPNSAQVASDIDAVAKATSMMRGNSKLWSNPSGTAATATARTAIGTVGLGGVGAAAGVVSPVIPLGAAAGIGATNLIGRGLTSQKVVQAMARRNLPSDRLTAADIQALNSLGLLSGSTEPR